MKSKNQGDRLLDKQEERQMGRHTGQTDIQINLDRQINKKNGMQRKRTKKNKKQ